VLGIADGVSGLPVHLADGDYVAAGGLFDLNVLFAGHDIKSAQLVGGGHADIAQGHVGGDLTGHDLNKAVFAELIGYGLEHEADGGAGGVDALGLRGVGNIVHDGAQQGLGANAGHCAAAEHGYDGAVLQSGLQTGDKLVLGKLHGVEVLLHKLLGGAGGGFHKLRSQFLGLGLVCVGHSHLGGLAAGSLVAHVVDKINNTGTVGHGGYDGADDRAVFFLQRGEHRVKVAVLFIQLGDVEHCGLFGRLEIFPAALGADGKTVLGGAQDEAGFNSADGAKHLAHKVLITGAVQHVDLAAAKFDGSQSGGYSDLALYLLGVVIADGVAVGDLAETVEGADREQHALGKTSLAAVSVAQQGNVADLVGVVAHVCFPLLYRMLLKNLTKSQTC